jgi:hypothetical protein
MPLSPTAPQLQQELQAAIFSGLQAQFQSDAAQAYPPYPAEVTVYFNKLATAISQIAAPLVTHLVANIMVNPGQAVVVAGIEGPEAGSTISPGTIS